MIALPEARFVILAENFMKMTLAKFEFSTSQKTI
jgi:hypothetical protein